MRVRDLFFAAILAAAAAHANSAATRPALKRTVAVYQFQTSSAPADPNGGAAAASSEALTAMLTDALIQDGRFVVVDRTDLGDIATEQKLGVQASTTAETAARAGHMIGASLIINGTVTKFEPNAKSSSLSLGMPVANGLVQDSLGLTHSQAVVEISLRVIDSTTGQVLATVKAEGTAPTQGLNLSAGASGGANVTASTLKTTPLGRAAEQAIQRAVPRLALAADRQPWSALVIEVDGPTVYVNAGAEENVQPGTLLQVRRKAKELVDPGTGVVLDTLMSDVAIIRIDGVRPKVSTASVVTGATPQRGDFLGLAK